MNKQTKIEKSLTIQGVSLSARQAEVINAITPPDFIKTKPGRGGKPVKFIEGGFVIAKLNQAFGNLGWEYEITDKIIEPKELAVLGKLTIKDHKQGYTLSKMQWGQATRHSGVPLGDSLKSASTDAMKKCGSLLGIALDIYWASLDDIDLTEKPAKTAKIAPKQSQAELFEQAKKLIAAQKDGTTLLQWQDKIQESKIYDEKQKKELLKMVDEKLDEALDVKK